MVRRARVGRAGARRRPQPAPAHTLTGPPDRGVQYDAAFEKLAASGIDVHGEADFVQSFRPERVLDAGCGTGRVAIELARRGIAVVGVDREESMLAQARRKAPELDWRLGDLATVKLREQFDAVVMAGNVMIFVTPGTEGAVVSNLSHALTDGGLLIGGFQADRHLSVADYDRHCESARLELVERWSTWDRQPWQPGGDYAVSVHRLALNAQVR